MSSLSAALSSARGKVAGRRCGGRWLSRALLVGALTTLLCCLLGSAAVFLTQFRLVGGAAEELGAARDRLLRGGASATTEQGDANADANGNDDPPAAGAALLRRRPSAVRSAPGGAADAAAPRAMIGIFMVDTPEAKLQRMILRVIYPLPQAVLRFVLCRPTAATALEPDVVAIDMEENMNEGKTHRWFEYAAENLPASVTAVFKLDTDAIFCISDLQRAMLQAESRSAYSYFGSLMNHAACSTSGFEHCPPAHCNDNNKFNGDCWYYMSGGFYGFSVPLLREVTRTPLFQAYSNGPQESHHEDVMSGRWVNQTVSRHLVSEEAFDYFHAKWLVSVNPPRVNNYFKAYYFALKERSCTQEADNVKREFEHMYANTKWRPNATAVLS